MVVSTFLCHFLACSLSLSFSLGLFSLSLFLCLSLALCLSFSCERYSRASVVYICGVERLGLCVLLPVLLPARPSDRHGLCSAPLWSTCQQSLTSTLQVFGSFVVIVVDDLSLSLSCTDDGSCLVLFLIFDVVDSIFFLACILYVLSGPWSQLKAVSPSLSHSFLLSVSAFVCTCFGLFSLLLFLSCSPSSSSRRRVGLTPVATLSTITVPPAKTS